MPRPYNPNLNPQQFGEQSHGLPERSLHLRVLRRAVEDYAPVAHGGVLSNPRETGRTGGEHGLDPSIGPESVRITHYYPAGGWKQGLWSKEMGPTHAHITVGLTPPHAYRRYQAQYMHNPETDKLTHIGGGPTDEDPVRSVWLEHGKGPELDAAIARAKEKRGR